MTKDMGVIGTGNEGTRLARSRAYTLHRLPVAGGMERVCAGAVREENERFAAGVQRAASMWGCADARAILVANVIRELCIGKGFLFADTGEQTLRGFEDAVRLYEVRWEEDASAPSEDASISPGY